MTPLETLLLVSFAMLTCLQTTLTRLNSRIRRGLIAQRWPVATWEPIIGGHAQCVWRTICISLPLSLWGDGTLLAGTLAVSTLGASCIYLFFCLTFSVSVCLSRSLCETLCMLNLHSLTLCPPKKAVQENKQSREIIVMMQGLLGMELFVITFVNTTSYSRQFDEKKQESCGLLKSNYTFKSCWKPPPQHV